ncbi:MAG TPA: hypothetical protein VF221_01915 [Chloroflexota bacterium]
MSWTWADYEPYYRELEARHLTADTVNSFVSDWSALAERVDETLLRLQVAADRDLSDVAAEERYRAFAAEVVVRADLADRVLRSRLSTGGESAQGTDAVIQSMRISDGDAGERSTPLSIEEWDIRRAYTRLFALQEVTWEGQRVPIGRLRRAYEGPDRRLREKAWRLEMERRLLDAPAIDELWRRVVRVRRDANAGADVAHYFHMPTPLPLTPDEARRFRDAVEEFVTSALVRIHERRRTGLGVRAFRPWDLGADPLRRRALTVPDTEHDLVCSVAAALSRVDDRLAENFQSWCVGEALHLKRSTRKVPWGHCSYLPVTCVPYIIQNPSGSARDVEELLHLCGVATFLAGGSVPYLQRRHPAPEALEMSGVATELRVLHGRSGGAEAIYTGIDIARARMVHLERSLLRWALAAMLDAFQRDAYGDGARTASIGERWSRLWLQFLPSVDVTGLEDVMANEWQRHSELFLRPLEAAPRAMGQLVAWRAWIDGGEEHLSRAVAEVVDGSAGFDANDLHDVARWIEDQIEHLERAME